MWYYSNDGQQSGPISQAELQQKLQTEIAADTLVWKDGMATWTKANEVAELHSSATQPIDSPAITEEIASQAENPYAAPTAVGIATPGIAGFDEIPAEPIKLDIGFCIRQGWKFTTRNFGEVFLLWFAYMMTIMIVGGVLAGIGSAIDGPQPTAVTNFDGMSPSEALQVSMQQADQKGPVQSILEIPSQIFQTYLGMGLFAFSLALVRGQKTSISMLFSQSGGKLMKVVFASILYGLMVGIGFICLIIPGIYLALRFMYYHAAIIDKDLGVIESLKYSSQLTRDNKLSLLGLGFLSSLIVLAGAIALLFGLLWAIPTVWLASTIAYCYLHGGEKSIAVQD